MLLNYDFLEVLRAEDYPEKLTEQHLIDCFLRLSHVTFDVTDNVIERFYYEETHFSNLLKIYIEFIICSLFKKGKTKQELFRDNSVHLKTLKRYLASFASKFREEVMMEPLEKVIKAFKGFNLANSMNEAKCSGIREAVTEGYASVLDNMKSIPRHVLDMICSIYE